MQELRLWAPRNPRDSPCKHSSHLLSFPSGSDRDDERDQCPFRPLLETRHRGWGGSAKQPPLPPALPAPSLAGGRQLCGCSAHLPPPESLALKLPGCGQPCCHGNCILHPCRRLHLKAIRENRGTGETEEGEKTGLGLAGPSFPAQCSLLTASHTDCQLPKPVPRPLEGQPHTTPSPFLPLPPGGGGTMALLLERVMELIKISLTAQP